jgi:hypothetical protein
VHNHDSFLRLDGLSGSGFCPVDATQTAQGLTLLFLRAFTLATQSINFFGIGVALPD